MIIFILMMCVESFISLSLAAFSKNIVGYQVKLQQLIRQSVVTGGTWYAESHAATKLLH